ncbi:uncharacterized protein METZ01_LOCUS62731, partial [marine metagenome]
FFVLAAKKYRTSVLRKSLSSKKLQVVMKLPATFMIKYLKKRIKNKWLLIILPFLFFLIKGLIWLAIFYGLWDVIKSAI